MQWRAVIRQLVALRLLRVDYDRFNILQLTPDAREVLEWPQDSQAAKAIGEAPAATQAQAGSAIHRCRHATRLPANRAMSSRHCASGARAWRRSMGFRRTPCFTMPRCRRSRGCLPDSLDGLRGISGIGATKLERYGELLLKVVRECDSVPAGCVSSPGRSTP